MNAYVAYDKHKADQIFILWINQAYMYGLDYHLGIMKCLMNHVVIDEEYQKQTNGIPIGRSNQNPFLNTCLNEVKCTYGEITELAANIIAESKYPKGNLVGNEYLLLESFVKDRKDDTGQGVEEKKIVIIDKKTIRKITDGWDIHCKWNDGLTSW